MQTVRYQATHSARWDSFVGAARNGHFMHQRGYMDYHSSRFADHSLMIHDADDQLVALLPANEANGTLYSHQGLTFGGLILANDTRAEKVLAALQAVVDYARAQKFNTIVYKPIPTIYHRVPAQDDEYALFRVGAQLTRVDISTAIEQSSRLPYSTLRTRGAKKAKAAGVTIRRSEDFASYHAILRAILSEKYDAQVTHSVAELELLAGRFPDSIALFGAFQDTAMLAGVVMFETATTAHAQYIGASKQGRDLGALDLLFHQLISEHYAHKKFFDFGISTEQRGTYLNGGLIAQKEGFGGRGMVHREYSIPMTACA